MNTFIKKFLILAFVVTIVPSFAHAQVFNTTANRSNTIYICNDTKASCASSTGGNNWQTAVSADAGDNIAIMLVYKNDGTSTANNVAVSLSPLSVSSTTSTIFTGSVIYNGASVASGRARLDISSAQSLVSTTENSACGSATCWYDNGPSNYPIALGNSMSVGDVNSGEYGAIVAHFKVSGTYNPNPNPNIGYCSVNLTSNIYSVYSGNPATLSWTSSNCTNLTINGVGSGLNSSGSQVVYPYGTMTYTLTGQGNNGTAQSQVVIYTNNNNNNNYPVYQSCSIYSFTADRTYINRGENTGLHWSSTADHVAISPLSINYGAASSTTVVSPATSTTYQLTAYCQNGYTQTQNVTVNVANTATSTMQADTTPATLVHASYAQLNGILTPNNNGNATTWFEYGLTGSFGNKTNAQSVSAASSSYVDDTITGLTPGNWYYYRVVLQNQSGTVYGDIVRFQTKGGAVDVVVPTHTATVHTIVNNTVIAKSAPSLLELKVNSQYDRMCVNGDMQYTVSYQNISTTTLKDAVLRITHPKDLTFEASTLGTYEVLDHAVTIDVGNLAPNQSGIVVLTFKVNSDATQGELTVTTASMVYTNPLTTAQEDATAYSLITVSNDCPTASTLGASAFGTSFLPHTLLEWLLLILVILALIILARQLYKKNHQA